MYCVSCGSTGNKKLYLCTLCKDDGEPDLLMCSSCTEEHDDANESPQDYDEFHECGECGNVLYEDGTPFIPFIPDDDRDN